MHSPTLAERLRPLGFRTGGIVGFCSGTSDMLAVVTEYARRKPGNGLARYLPALRAVDGSDSHKGLDPGFPGAWRAAAGDPVFRKVQEDARDRMYFTPAVRLAEADGLRALGQFAYYDAAKGWAVEPGDYEATAGRHSLDNEALRVRFMVV